ncbi:MAG: transcriptional regulator [Sulfurimonas sp. RIFCSPHIGHO2_12_FULL_36_9]|uniref:helix-turn-helix domain-containing protein n=1 Tax=Sulfurimonas sp. RIFCSPLOWO2_12_36_12 TaxID=1802253 RepID=UPI0008C0713A|nr:XRE family transcriptional regulator [Sulfurimonas sp. RIFCSPLOWO2_12_36_12]OHD97590.1 MAG: transcriptional regulator [Sulfurimonas sp. RIFCSPLOWO2_02_FULL_36_28]OHD97702.1 MAG: transcriptional regulator [Sulfurimonas sp. RIFCSPHIGHO2_12_FULL_36_9]OHE01856.1 MAG: transcriptional regulator [Sulfurimonas sp. RIFCSPLOWO2_12_36_12]OHE04776.1 MAG: transcriptional regulator [Sulfurimonas sp. RIFCSPLOWO2_12_FULL_36_74]
MKIIDFEDGCLEDFYGLISKNVIRIRKEKKVSQLKLANAIGHQNATFLGKAELLAENKHFNLEHLYKISTALEVNISEFFKEI